jgi:hypothetical protein
MDASFALQDRLSQHHQIKLLETPPWTDPDTPLIVRLSSDARISTLTHALPRLCVS